ncbi:MAG: endo-1,4-beta-xylanase [Chloroflexi bacterium]|nr:endo-1,4-beta-xylanase [Chloroflexota bacterium]
MKTHDFRISQVIVVLLFALSACATPTALPVPTTTIVPLTLTPLPTTTPTISLPLPTAAHTAVPTSTATKSPTPTFTPIPTATPTRPPTLTPTPIPCTGSLRACAERKQIEIGTYFNSNWFGDSRWREIVGREFNLAVISAGFYWHDIERTRGQYNFAFVDEQVAFARSKKMQIVGHALLLAESGYLPDWIASGNFSREELTQLLHGFIAQTMTRYKGQISEYLVVEDVALPPNTDADIFYRKFGYDYVDLVFQIARETDPSAVLIYNADDNETSDGKATAYARNRYASQIERIDRRRRIGNAPRRNQTVHQTRCDCDDEKLWRAGLCHRNRCGPSPCAGYTRRTICPSSASIRQHVGGMFGIGRVQEFCRLGNRRQVFVVGTQFI